jgi:DNA-binding winged helix-turn-helix (wHTH) protein
VKYRFAHFEIDTNRHELRQSGAVVHIEPQVFDLIVHFVRNRDRIVSKDELIETIWNGRIISEAALSSRINGARRALGDNGNDQIFIKTFHKRGFRFLPDVQEISASSDREVSPLIPGAVASGGASANASITEVGGLTDVSETTRAAAVTRSSIAVDAGDSEQPVMPRTTTSVMG